MPKFKERGAVQFILLLILLLGIAGGVWLVTSGPLKIFPKAAPTLPSAPEASFELELEKSGEPPFTDEATPATIPIGSKFRVDIYARSDTEAANLFKAAVKYSSDTVDFVEVNKRDGQSFVKKWVETSVDNSNQSVGVVKVVGGVPAPGIQTDSKTGAFLLGSIIFKAKQTGTAKIGLSDGNSAIYSNANNINILTAVKGTIEVPITDIQPSPTPISEPLVEPLSCSTITVTGAVEGKVEDQIIYIVDSEGKVNLQAHVTPKNSKVVWTGWHSKYLPNGGTWDPPDSPTTVWTAPKNSVNTLEGVQVRADIVNTSPTVSCKPVNMVVRPVVTSRSISCEVYGDLNLDGIVNDADRDILSKIVAGQIIPSNSSSGDTQYMNTVGDINGDQKITSEDVSLLGRYIQGLDSNIPVCQQAKLPPCQSYGDVSTDGKVTPFDGYEALRMDVGYKDSLYTKNPYTDDQKRRSDVDNDGKVTSVDGLKILRYVKGMDQTFAVCGVTPSPSPTAGFQRVFVTSTKYNANLGGLSGADAICQERANTANLGGSWKAWLSDSVTSASSRLVHSTNPYKLLDGRVVANDWTDLTDGTIQNPIEITELGSRLTAPATCSWCGFGFPWTNTNNEGNPVNSNANRICNNFTSSAATGDTTSFRQGYAFGTGPSQWTVYAVTSDCPAANELYCFEQTSATPSPSTQKGSGDGNSDGKVDLADLSILLTDFNKNGGVRTGIDLNGDGVINSFDFSLMRNLLIQKGVIGDK